MKSNYNKQEELKLKNSLELVIKQSTDALNKERSLFDRIVFLECVKNGSFATELDEYYFLILLITVLIFLYWKTLLLADF